MAETRYAIEEPERGRGGFGRVAKGFDKILERPVAIKTLDPLISKARKEDRDRFHREARILASLRHSSIPAIYDVQFSDAEFRIVFEFIEGRTLRELLDEGIPAVDTVQRWFGQVAAALEHAHGRGIVHRDVKPSNIIIADGLEHAYLVDFGIALSLGDQRRVSASGDILGTPGYMSPEHEDGEEVDAASDVYVLGVCLYEALCGHRIPAGEYQPLSIQNDAIPPAIDALILSCIAPRYQRIESAAEFGRRLQRAVAVTAPLPDVLAGGRLHELIGALRGMDPDAFIKLQAGQRLLVLNKALGLVENQDSKLETARLEFLRILPWLAIHVDGEMYRRVIKPALVAGFEKQSGSWIGDKQVREAVQRASVEVRNNHSVLVKEILGYLNDTELEEKSPWFFHGFRDILSGLMANRECTDKDAQTLFEMLEKINAFQRKATYVDGSCRPQSTKDEASTEPDVAARTDDA